MPCGRGQQGEKGILRAAIALAERMNGIELGEELCRPCGEPVAGQTAQGVARPETGEHARQLPIDVLGIAENAAVLRQAHCARPSGPRVDILEEVAVHRAVVADREAPSGQRLLGPGEVSIGVQS